MPTLGGNPYQVLQQSTVGQPAVGGAIGNTPAPTTNAQAWWDYYHTGQNYTTQPIQTQPGAQTPVAGIRRGPDPGPRPIDEPMARLKQLMPGYGGSMFGAGGAGSGAGAGGGAAYGAGAGPNVPVPPAPGREAGPTVPAGNEGQDFARTKDQAARVGNTAMQALRDQMVQRGIEGSGVEGELTRGVVSDVANMDVQGLYNILKQKQAQEFEASKQTSAQNVAQRGQDIGLLGEGYGGQITQRGQNLEASRLNSPYSWLSNYANLLGNLNY